MKKSIRIILGVLGAAGLIATLIGAWGKGSPNTSPETSAPVTSTPATSAPSTSNENVWAYQPQVGMQNGQPLVTKHFLLFTTRPCDPSWLGEYGGKYYQYAVYIMNDDDMNFANPLAGGCWYKEVLQPEGAQVKPVPVAIYNFNLNPSDMPVGFDEANLLVQPKKKAMEIILSRNHQDAKEESLPNFVKQFRIDMKDVLNPYKLPGILTESDIKPLNIKLGFAPTAIKQAVKPAVEVKAPPVVAPPTPLPPAVVSAPAGGEFKAAESLVDICVDKKTAAYRKEVGEEQLINYDQTQEWEDECKDTHKLKGK